MTVARRAATKVPARMPEILAAAAQVFYEHGYEASSIQDIADAVGLLKGSLYYYIDSKEDLLFGILQNVIEDLLPQFERWQSLEGTYLQRITTFIEEYVAHIIRHRVEVSVFFAEFDRLSPQRRTVIARSRVRYDQFLRDLIVRGQAEGSVAPDLNPKLATLSIFGMANSTHLWYRPEGGESATAISRHVARLTERALAT
jgi:TetR/AcrR family transcriptional regulator, cholesterol catabolism regulator